MKRVLNNKTLYNSIRYSSRLLCHNNKKKRSSSVIIKRSSVRKVKTKRKRIKIYPNELYFPMNKRYRVITSEIKVSNVSSRILCFKVKTTNPDRYSIVPNKGILLQNDVINVLFTVNVSNDFDEMYENDKFRIESMYMNKNNSYRSFLNNIENSNNDVKFKNIRVRFKGDEVKDKKYLILKMNNKMIIKVKDANNNQIIQHWMCRWKCQILLNEKLMIEIDKMKSNEKKMVKEIETLSKKVIKQKKNRDDNRIKMIIDNSLDEIKLKKLNLNELKKIKFQLQRSNELISVEYTNRIENENMQIKDEKLCCVCMVHKRNVLLIPCKHICMCLRCYKAIKKKNNLCPLCRQVVNDFVENIKL